MASLQDLFWGQYDLVAVISLDDELECGLQQAHLDSAKLVGMLEGSHHLEEPDRRDLGELSEEKLEVLHQEKNKIKKKNTQNH